jgi:DNA-binding transcriptional regulator YiaG
MAEEPATPKRRGRPPGSRNETLGVKDLVRREQAAKAETAALPAVSRQEQLAKLRELRQAMEVRTARRVLGLTTSELAYKLGASRGEIEQWEIGRVPVPRVVRLALRYLLLGILEPL